MCAGLGFSFHMNRNEKIVLSVSIVASALVIIAFRKFLKNLLVGAVEVAKEPVKMVLNATQEAAIAKLHPKAQETFREFLWKIKEKGYGVLVTSSYRTFAQQAYYKALNSNNAAVGLSPHNYGMALDLNLIKGTAWYRKESSKEKWESTGVPQIARDMNLRWGGDFKTYHDPVHFDLENEYPSEYLLLLARKQFGNVDDNVKGNKVIIP